jgi:DNA-binding NarL/FixJ family response regulator
MPSVKLIFLSAYENTEYMVEALRSGANGYVSKRVASGELLKVIRDVLNGQCYVGPLLTRQAFDLLAKSSKNDIEAPDLLSPRQSAVLQLIAEGKSRKEIAGLLKVSVRTVEFHKSAIMRVLHAKSVTDLALYAAAKGMVSLRSHGSMSETPRLRKQTA